MTHDKDKIYQDTVEIVKAAVTSSSEHNSLLFTNSTNCVAEFIKNVYKALCEINNDR